MKPGNSPDSSDDRYKKCCLYSKHICGPYTPGRDVVDGLVEIGELKNEVTSYLTNKLHYKDSHELSRWTEKLVIENRLGRTLDDGNQLCMYHRFTLGIGWQPSVQCSHPLHKKVKSGKKAAKAYRIPIQTLIELNNVAPYSYKLGDHLCKSHEKVAKETLKNESSNTSIVEEQDEEYTPTVFILTDEPEQSSDLLETLSVSPMKFRLSSPIGSYHESKIRYIKRKKEEFLNAADAYFDTHYAPGQSRDAIKQTLKSTDTDIPEDLLPLLENYIDSDSFGKMVILSLVNHDCHSKSDIMKVFGCSKRKVDQARSMRTKGYGVSKNEEVKIKRNRLNTAACEHFLDFLFSSGLMQDVAYGVTNLKFDSGNTQSIPHAILQTKFSHTIEMYRNTCEETNYKPLSRKVLWNILTAIKPSRRRSLAGLDDITAAGMNGFQYLNQMLTDMKASKDITNGLERAKRYLKMNFQGHCSVESSIVTHNTAFALSFQNEEPLLGVEDGCCVECLNLFETLQKVSEIAENRNDADLQYDVRKAIDSIVSYMQHQIRDVQQREAKIYCFAQLSEGVVFWLRDYSQKILPTSYREGQKSYFGKKGMTLHIDVFFTKLGDELEKIVYFTVVYRCDQSKIETMIIADHVLSELSKDFPSCYELYGKSDNASCYHGNQILQQLYSLCNKMGITMLRYDYNEPCKGKDQCDREAAGAKSLINSYVESGNDLLCAEDIYSALHYGNGIRNSKVSVIEIDGSGSVLTGPNIPNINSYHSVQFSKKSMKLQRYFNIGKGTTVEYSAEAKFTPKYTVKLPFSSTARSKLPKRKQRENSKSVLFCPEYMCSMVFQDEKEYDRHMLSEQHTIVKETSAMDKVRASFVKRMKLSSSEHHVHATSQVRVSESPLSVQIQQNPLFSNVTKQGWGIPKRSNFRYSYAQKKFLYDAFMEGEETGKKRSPEEVERSLRLHFSSPEEYVTPSQIRALFSSFTRKLKDGTLKPPTCGLTDNSDEATVSEEEPFESAAIHGDFIDVVEEVMCTISTFEPGMWVVIRYKKQWLPGQVLCSESFNEPVDEDSFVVDCMERKKRGSNLFKWPCSKDLAVVERSCMLLATSEVIPIDKSDKSSCEEIVWCKLSDQDFLDANEALRRALRDD